MNYDLDTRRGMKNAIIWTQTMLRDLNVGGVWAIPRSGTMVRKTSEESVVITEGFAKDECIARVIAKAGYKVTHNESTT